MPNQETDQNTQSAVQGNWRRRIYAVRWLLIAAIGVLIYFLVTGGLAGHEVSAGIAIILAVAILTDAQGVVTGGAQATQATMPIAGGPSGASVLDALPEPCFLLDRRAIVMHLNAAAKQQFPKAGIGNPFAFSLRNPDLLAAIDAVVAGGETRTIELHLTVPSATWFKVHVAPLDFSPAATPRDEISGWVLVSMQSLTEQKRIEGMRSDFIANASHELRTPLTSLAGFIETLQGPAAADKEAQEKFLGIMRAQAQRMSNLIDDLLSLSRIELRQHVRPTDSVDVSLILSEVVEALQTQAKEADVKVKLNLPDDRIEVTGDRDELYEVFENLIDNAIKYGADGDAVTITAQHTDRTGYDFSVSVEDQGAGIAEEHVPRLTERFYRVDAESSRKKKGTGLGLAIVKHILNRHGGLFVIRSELGKGTRAEIFLQK